MPKIICSKIDIITNSSVAIMYFFNIEYKMSTLCC